MVACAAVPMANEEGSGGSVPVRVAASNADADRSARRPKEANADFEAVETRGGVVILQKLSYIYLA